MNKGFWKHIEMKDVFVQILDVKFYSDYVLIRVDWWNKSYAGRNPWILLEDDMIKVEFKDYDKWSKYEFTP